jgi:hypothetical protein
VSTPSPDASQSQTSSRETASGKGRATPTRREREEANKRPLVVNDRKAAAKANRETMNEARARARLGMAAGDERYLPARDQGVQRKYARDFVDARYNFGEMMLPFMVLVILMTFMEWLPTVRESSVLVLWGFFFIAVTDCLILSVQLRSRLTKKFGSVEKGVRWYASMRSLQMRPMRLPKPQVKRRQFPQ